LTVVPGNHDQACNALAVFGRVFCKQHVPKTYALRTKLFRQCFGELMQSTGEFQDYELPFAKVLSRAGVVLVGVDSTQDDVRQRGEIGPEQLENLNEILSKLKYNPRFRNHAVLLALHHAREAEPETLGIEDDDELSSVIDGRVHAVLYGHAHAPDVDRGGTHNLVDANPGSIGLAEDSDPTGKEGVVQVFEYAMEAGQPAVRTVRAVEISLGQAITARQARFRKQYAPLFRPASPCGDCGGPVAPEMRYCPWCSQLSDFSHRHGYVCKDCNQPVMPGYSVCPWCRADFDEDGGRYDTGKRMSDECPACGSGVEPYHQYCPSCGATQEPPDDAHDDEPCTECNWPVDRDVYLFCPWCQEVL